MRSQAREKAFQLIFERLFVKNEYLLDEEFFVSLKKEEDINFAKSILENFNQNKDYLSSLIKENLVGYEIDRVYKIDLALIYLALTEIFYLNTPQNVVINEVIELSKVYSTEKSYKFINGILSSILNQKV